MGQSTGNHNKNPNPTNNMVGNLIRGAFAYLALTPLIFSWGLLLIFLSAILACTPDTLQSTFEKDQQSNGMDGVNIIHIEENEAYGLVLATTWTEQTLENKDRPGINVYLQEDGQWMAIPGTDCDGPMFTLGIQGNGYLYCGSISEKRPYVKILVGETEAQIFDVNDKKRVWYVVGKSRGMVVQGSYTSGELVRF